jgi:hypothetical protein
MRFHRRSSTVTREAERAGSSATAFALRDRCRLDHVAVLKIRPRQLGGAGLQLVVLTDKTRALAGQNVAGSRRWSLPPRVSGITARSHLRSAAAYPSELSWGGPTEAQPRAAARVQPAGELLCAPHLLALTSPSSRSTTPRFPETLPSESIVA